MLLKLPLFTCQWQVNTVETIELCQIGSYFDFLLCFILGNPLTEWDCTLHKVFS